MSSLNGSLCLWLFINVLNIYCDSLEGQINKAIVQTTGGLVLGETWGKNWYRFRGIPFAEPPIGDLRFEGQINKAIVQTTGGLVLGETWGKNWYRFRGIPFAEPPIGDLRFEGQINKAIVQTTGGLVLGETWGKNWYRFRGIPFAEPPIGDLRFEPPVPKRPWEGILNVTEKGSCCIQGGNSVQGSEDCLIVKIYTPKAPHPNHKLPVVVWIYGGAFYMGEADFDGGKPDLLLKEGVIVAAIHYRVGLFGFLATEDSTVPGNAGLKDQILALQWIKENIRNFGGDPEKITIFGQSAGSASIAYLLQAPQTEGLYSGAIMLSGSSLDTWSITRNPLKFAKTVASCLKINTWNTKRMVEELRKRPAEEIQKVTASKFKLGLLSNPLGGLPLGPVVEPNNTNAVITGRSHDLLKRGKFNRVPIFIGHTSLEAHSNDELSFAIKLVVSVYLLNPSTIVPLGMHISNPVTKGMIGEKIKQHYFGILPLIQNATKALKWISEDQFVRGIYEAVRLYSKMAPVYYYNFAHEGNLYKDADRSRPGVGHTEDLGYIFDFGRNGSETDCLVRDRFVRLVTNFVKYRNPTPQNDKLLQNIHWPANNCTSGSECDIKQLHIKENLTIVNNPYKDNANFWKDLFEKKGGSPFDTY